MTVKQLSVFVENKPGKLSKLIGLLAKNEIDLRAISIADTNDFGIVRIIADNPKKAIEVLGREDFLVNATDVVAVKVPDRPGGLSELLCLFEKDGINIEYMYALFTRDETNAFMVLRVKEMEKTEALLSLNGYESVSADVLGIHQEED